MKTVVSNHGYAARRTQSWQARHQYHKVKVHQCPLCFPWAPWAVPPSKDRDDHIDGMAVDE